MYNRKLFLLLDGDEPQTKSYIQYAEAMSQFGNISEHCHMFMFS